MWDFVSAVRVALRSIIMGISKEEFRSALSRFPSGVTVVTSKDAAGRLHGITVSAFASVSLEPPLVLVCIDKETGSHRALRESEYFVINILGAGQEEISNLFASRSAGKFETVGHRPGLGEIPVLDEALATLECRLAYAHEGGDHTIFVGEIERSSVKDAAPLVYWHSDYRELKIDNQSDG
jgi:flavin reductase (DIM6/NTAB) family NADH-FMN oxidoreductase RutF